MIFVFLVVCVLILVIILSLKKALNQLIVIGFVYVIRRDTGRKTDPIVSLGFMRGLSYPWYQGKGIQVRIGTQILQIGLCRSHKQHKDETTGTLDAIGGRYLDTTAEQIRDW